MKTCLVTGAAGFIGSHLCEKLIELGYCVLGIDNLSVGRDLNLRKIDNKNFEFLKTDVTNFESLKDIFSSHKIDFVFHLAALADIVPSVESPLRYFENNVLGTANVLELSRLNKVSKFLYSASSSCYGIPDHFPTDENAEIRPEYPYALTKFLGEQLALHWGKVYELDVVSLRLFNVYGPRARTSGTYGAVFGVFLAQKLAGKPLTVIGDGNQTRDFTYVSDVVEAFCGAAFSQASGEVFNVGSGGTYSINKLTEILGGDIVRIPKRPGEPDCTFADIRKIQEKLMWIPKVKFEDGVRSMLSNLQDWADAPIWTPESIKKETELWFKFLGQRVLSSE